VETAAAESEKGIPRNSEIGKNESAYYIILLEKC
jgi:hypothetical protein